MTDPANSAADNPSHGNLLDFTPVPRKVKRPDGWTPELQREFIRRLAETGSPQQACVDMDKKLTGIEALYQVPTADSFRAAWHRAVQIGRTAQGLDGSPPHLGPVPGIRRRPARGHTPSPPEGEGWGEGDAMSEDDKHDFLKNIILKFLRKVQAERTARLAGEVVAADFYLRQVTVLEVALDLLSEGMGLDGWELLADLRRGGHGILDLAETAMSRMLDDKRREVWRRMGQPDRPEHPPRRYLEHHGDHSSEPMESFRGGGEESMEEQHARLAARHEADAEAQVMWERESTEAKAGE